MELRSQMKLASKFLFLKKIIGRFTKKIRMVALLMTEIFNFTTIEEKNEF